MKNHSKGGDMVVEVSWFRWDAEHLKGFSRVYASVLLKRDSVQLPGDSYATSLLPRVGKDAAFLANRLNGRVELDTAVAVLRSQSFTEDARRLKPDHGRVGRDPRSENHDRTRRQDRKSKRMNSRPKC